MANLGETLLIEYYVSSEIHNKLQDFETDMLNKYIGIIRPYEIHFRKIGYELKVELGWANSRQKIWSSNRIPFMNGYKCYVYCLVEKDGEIVRVESNDGEADYYPLIAEWMISSIYRNAFKLKASICTALDDVEADVAELLLKLESSRKIAAR